MIISRIFSQFQHELVFELNYLCKKSPPPQYIEMEKIIRKLKSKLKKLDKTYIRGTNESLLLFEILILILVLQYTFHVEPITIVEIITSVVSGLFLADLISGLIHIISDHVVIRKNMNPILRQIINEFHDHHADPGAFCRASNWELLRHTSITPLPLLTLLLNGLNKTPKCIILTQIVTYYVAHFSQLPHKCAHYINHATEEEKNTIKGKILIFLQKNHLLLSPEEHRSHHISKNYDINFCIVNGWANPLLNYIVKNTDIIKKIKEL